MYNNHQYQPFEATSLERVQTQYQFHVVLGLTLHGQIHIYQSPECSNVEDNVTWLSGLSVKNFQRYKTEFFTSLISL